MASSQGRLIGFPVDCHACRASIEGLCQDCTPKLRKVISIYKSGDKVIKAGRSLFRPTERCDSFFYLVDGWIVLYDLVDDGRRQILHFALPGTLLGLSPGKTAVYGADALTDAKVSVVPQNKFGSMIAEYPGIGLRLIWGLWRERNLAYDHLSSIGRRPARQRVARALLEIFVRFRMQWPGHVSEEMHLPLTQEHIGDVTGLSAVHVNRVLRRLRADGILQFHYRRLRVLDPDKLADVARIDLRTILSWT